MFLHFIPPINVKNCLGSKTGIQKCIMALLICNFPIFISNVLPTLYVCRLTKSISYVEN